MATRVVRNMSWCALERRMAESFVDVVVNDRQVDEVDHPTWMCCRRELERRARRGITRGVCCADCEVSRASWLQWARTA